MTMKVACDQCQKTVHERGLVGWLRLETHGLDVSGFGERREPHHFCSLACLAAWATKRAEIVAAVLAEQPSAPVSSSPRQDWQPFWHWRGE